MGFWTTFRGLIWDNDAHLKTEAEKKLVRKLDCAILTTIAFSWVMKYIDQNNLANAYVSGMKQDLNILANEYTYMNTVYNIALCIVTIPGSLIVLKVRPSWWLAGCELAWGVMTFAQAGAHTVPQMYAFRFLLGVFEASFAPVAVFLMGSWYTKAELAKRISIYFICGPAGQAFSGFLQAAVYKGLNGHLGIAGWRWLYIICGCMTLPGCVSLFFLLPDYPANTRAWYLSAEEKQMAMERCARNGTAAATGTFTFAIFKKILSSWRIWLIVPIYIIFACSVQDANYFGIWLASAGYSVADRNLLSSACFLIAIPFACIYAWTSDYTKNRWLCMAVPEALSLIPLGILAVWPEGKKIKLFAFLFCDTVLVTHIFYTYINELCSDSAEERNFILGTINALFYSVNAWLPILIFPQTTGPSFRRGFPTTFAFAIASIFGFALLRYMEVRQNKIKATAGVDEESSLEENEKEVAKDSGISSINVLTAPIE